MSGWSKIRKFDETHFYRFQKVRVVQLNENIDKYFTTFFLILSISHKPRNTLYVTKRVEGTSQKEKSVLISIILKNSYAKVCRLGNHEQRTSDENETDEGRRKIAGEATRTHTRYIIKASKSRREPKISRLRGVIWSPLSLAARSKSISHLVFEAALRITPSRSPPASAHIRQRHQ